MNIIDFAKFYIDQGWQVLPLLAKNKKPLVPWKNGGATDINTVRGWFDMWPDANLGIVTGKNSGIIALDVDPKHGGDESLFALTEQYWIFPDTPIAHTGGGGLHYIFSYPGFEISNSAGKLGTGLDIRADGGQICAPPSMHASGKQYKWDEHYKPSKFKPAAAPQWLLDLLINDKKIAVQKPADEKDFYEEGTRNSSLTSLAGTMHHRNMTKETISLALQNENICRCYPPLPKEEITAIVESVSRYPTGQHLFGEKHVYVSMPLPTSSTQGLEELKKQLEKPQSFVGTGLVSLDDKLGGLPRGRLTLLAARPGMGKTTMAMQIARNASVAGNKVLFVSLEMTGEELWLKAALGIAEVSWRDYALGEVPAGTKEKLQNEIIPELMRNLGDRLFIYDKEQSFTNTEMLDGLVKTERPDLVIVDHLAYMADQHENEIKRLGLICRRLRAIAQDRNVAMLLLHHANRSTDSRQNETKEPRMADIRGSGEIEQVSDIILMPYIPSNYDMQEEKPRVSVTYIPVVKNRIGQVGIHLVFYFDGLGQWFYRKGELPEHLVGRDLK